MVTNRNSDQQKIFSMSFRIETSRYFDVEAKRLNKKYPSFKNDYKELLESLKERPLQGVELLPSVRKIRFSIKSKGKGKSGGARVITHNLIISENEGRIALLLLYDKNDASTVKTEVLKEILKELGY